MVYPHAPVHIVTALAGDQFDIAGLVIARSPVLRDGDLIARLAVAGPRIQKLIADRPEVSANLALAVCRLAAAPAVAVLLANANARICDRCLALAAERHIDDAGVRGALLDHPGLSPVLRLRVLNATGDALSASPLVGGLLGAAGARHVSQEATASALVHLAGGRMENDTGELIEELRSTGALTTKLLIRAVCNGKIDFVARVLADLSGQSYERVTAILVDERRNHLRALLDTAGLARNVQPLFETAIRIWREVANGRLNAGAQEVTRIVLEDFKVRAAERMEHANDDILALLRSIHLDMLRQNARRHALDLAAA